MIKKILTCVIALCAVFALAVPSLAVTDSGVVYGRYNMSLPSTFEVPDIGVTVLPVTGSFVADGVTRTLRGIQAYHSGVVFLYGSNEQMDIYTLNSGFTVDDLSLDLDTYQLDLALPVDSWLYDWLRASDWVDAPQPFPDSITSSLSTVLTSFGGVLTAVTASGGALAPLLPLIGISVAVSIALLVFLIIKRSTTI